MSLLQPCCIVTFVLKILKCVGPVLKGSDSKNGLVPFWGLQAQWAHYKHWINTWYVHCGVQLQLPKSQKSNCAQECVQDTGSVQGNLSCYHHKVPRTITVGVGAKSHCHKYSDKIYEHDHDYGNNLDKRQHINKLEAQGLHQKREKSISKLCKTKKHK